MSLGTFLLGDRPLGHLVWWTSSDDRRPATGEPARAAERALAAACGLPVLERSGVYWVAPEFDAELAALRVSLARFRGWELHTAAVRATADTLRSLRASATRAMEASLAALSTELETLLAEPRKRASLLVRQLDTLERLRRQDEVNQRHLALPRENLLACLDEWARRIDDALRARIVA